MADGYLNFNTEVDTSGFDKASNEISGTATKTANDVISESQKVKQSIQTILDDETRSAKSKAASIAGIYRKQGLDQSEALAKAWTHIERGSADVNDDMVRHSKTSHQKIRKEFGKTGDYAETSFSTALSSIKSMLGKIAVAAAAAFSVKALVDFGKQAIETASDMQEVQNVVNTAFGEMSYKMEEFADSAIEMYGISKLTAKQTGSVFAAMGNGMGLALDNATDMAVALTGLSADMASFYNVEQDVASTALKSIYTGETETLKQFGIVMTQTNLQAYALSQGITKSYQAMTEAEKVQLRYGFVMKSTALAQGDFAKTSGGWANQTRILSEQWKEFGSIVGNVLMNVLLPVVKAVNSALSQLISWASTAAQAIADLFGFELDTASTATQTASAVASTADSYDAMADSAEATAKANEKSLAGFDKVTKLNDNSSSGSSGGSSGASATPVSVNTTPMETGIKKSFNGISSQTKQFVKKLKNLLKPLGETFKDVFGDIKSLAAPLGKYFKNDFPKFFNTTVGVISGILRQLFEIFNTVFSDIWNIAVFPVLNNFVAVVLPVITEFAEQVMLTLGTLFDTVSDIFMTLWNGVLKPVLSLITQIWLDLWQIISDAWETHGQPIFDGIREGIQTVGDLFQTTWDNFLGPLFDKIFEVLTELWNDHLKPLVDKIVDFIAVVIECSWQFYNDFIAPITKWLIEKLGPVFSNVFCTIAEVVGTVVGGIADNIGGLITTIKGIIEFITGVFTGDWDKAWQGVKDIFSGIWETFEAIVKTPINAIIGFINGFIRAFCDGINVVIKALNKLSFDVPDWVPGIGGETWGFDIKEVKAPEIPKLATGTVVPANFGEFKAILGDNKREPEIVSPLSTMKQAVVEALREYGGGEIRNILYLDSDVVYDKVVEKNRQNTIRTGENALAT